MARGGAERLELLPVHLDPVLEVLHLEDLPLVLAGDRRARGGEPRVARLRRGGGPLRLGRRRGRSGRRRGRGVLDRLLLVGAVLLRGGLLRLRGRGLARLAHGHPWLRRRALARSVGAYTLCPARTSTSFRRRRNSRVGREMRRRDAGASGRHGRTGANGLRKVRERHGIVRPSDCRLRANGTASASSSRSISASAAIVGSPRSRRTSTPRCRSRPMNWRTVATRCASLRSRTETSEAIPASRSRPAPRPLRGTAAADLARGTRSGPAWARGGRAAPRTPARAA